MKRRIDWMGVFAAASYVVLELLLILALLAWFGFLPTTGATP